MSGVKPRWQRGDAKGVRWQRFSKPKNQLDIIAQLRHRAVVVDLNFSLAEAFSSRLLANAGGELNHRVAGILIPSSGCRRGVDADHRADMILETKQRRPVRLDAGHDKSFSLKPHFGGEDVQLFHPGAFYRAADLRRPDTLPDKGLVRERGGALMRLVTATAGQKEANDQPNSGKPQEHAASVSDLPPGDKIGI